MQTQLIRSQHDKVIGGVAAGVARYLNVDPVWVRLGFVALALGSGFGLVLYLALWLVMPAEGSPAIFNQVVAGAQQVGQQVTNSVSTAFSTQGQPAQPRFDPMTGQPLAQPVQARNQKLGIVLLSLGGLMVAGMLNVTGPAIAVGLMLSGWYLLRRS